MSDHCQGHALLSPSGEIDIATAPELRAELVDVAAQDSSSLVVIDLGGVSFLDSVGISVLVGGYRRLNAEGRRFHLASPGPLVRRVLDITQLTSIIPTYETVADALASCPRPHVA